jgi:hypothetical protein
MGGTEKTVASVTCSKERVHTDILRFALHHTVRGFAQNDARLVA